VKTHTHGARQHQPFLKAPDIYTCMFMSRLSLCPTLGGGYGKGTLRHPGASCRGVSGHHAISLKPSLGTVTASGFFHCPDTCFSLEWRQKRNRHPRHRPTTPPPTIVVAIHRLPTWRAIAFDWSWSSCNYSMLAWTTMPGLSRNFSVGTRCAITRPLSAPQRTHMSTPPTDSLASSCLLYHTSRHTVAAPVVGIRSILSLSQ
jgi:hypothetical protein